MKCPVDQAELVMSERQGVEIDYCPTCRGVWLDRGELDKILDRAAALAPAPGSAPTSAPSGGAPAYGTPPPDTRTAYPDPRHTQRYDEPRYDEPRYDERSRYGSSDPRHGDPRSRRKKKRESWLGDLLDFD